MKTLISDLGGVLYSFSKTFDPDEHENEFLKALESLECTEEFNGIVAEYKIGMSKKILIAENKAVTTGILKIYPNKKGVNNLISNLNIYDLFVVSTSLVDTSKFVLETVGINLEHIKIFDMSDCGSKKDIKSWEKIFSKLPNVDIIVEDGKKNLEAAGIAANRLGYSPKLYDHMPKLT